MGHNCAVLNRENIQCNFMYEDLARKLELYLTGNTNQKIDESKQEEVDKVESGKIVRANWSIQPMKVNERLCEWIITLKPKNNPARSLLQELDGSKDTSDTKIISVNKDETSTIKEGMHDNKNAIATDGVGTSHKESKGKHPHTPPTTLGSCCHAKTGMWPDAPHPTTHPQ